MINNSNHELKPTNYVILAMEWYDVFGFYAPMPMSIDTEGEEWLGMMREAIDKKNSDLLDESRDIPDDVWL